MALDILQSMYSSVFGPVGGPSIDEDPKAWWIAFDKLTLERYNLQNPLPFHHHRDQPRDFYDELCNEDVILEFVSARRITASSQLDHSRLFVRLLADEDFEDFWTALSPEDQEKYLLEAFAAVEKSLDYSMFIASKADCPELDRAALFADRGLGFIELMRQCVLSDNNEAPSQPRIFENARFDDIIGYVENDPWKSRAALHAMARMTRSSYIDSFVFATAMAAKGAKVTYRQITTEHSKTKSTLKAHSPMIDSVLGKPAGKEYKKAEAKRRKDMGLYCQSCLKPEEKAINGKMTVCSRCKQIGREIRYCGRECQVADWKQHKPSCGKPLDISAALADVHIKSDGQRKFERRPDIPPCPPDHRRSPHVVRLIEHLETSPSQDYLRDFEGDWFNGASLDEVTGACIFIHMRNVLFTSTGPGAEGALLYVYRVLQNFAPGGHGERGLQTQLKREYGMDMWNRMQALLKRGPPYYVIPDITRAQMDEVLGHLKKTSRFTEELMGYTIGEGKTMMIGSMVGPTKDVIAKVVFPKDAAPTPTLLLPSATRKATGSKAIGPNFSLPTPVDHADDMFIHAEFCDLTEQIRYLQMNPEADYMIWGHPDSPNTPLALQFSDFTSATSFLYYRYMLFKYGAFDIDALVYVIMALRPVLRRKKVPEEVWMAQLGREYDMGYVDIARSSIVKREEDGKEVYKRRDGRVFEMGQILLREEDVSIRIMHQLKAVGRFRELLASLKDL